MSGRPSPYPGQTASPRADRDRPARYAEDRSPRPSGGRKSSRSPRRAGERYDDRERGDDRERNGGGRDERDREREHERERRNPNNEPYRRDYRDRDREYRRDGKDDTGRYRDAARGERDGEKGKDWERTRPPAGGEGVEGQASRGPRGGYSGREYGRNGRDGRDYGRDEKRFDRPLDRRAIEEGRRRREEERARGVVYADDGTVIDPSSAPDPHTGSGTASPYPAGEEEEGAMDPAMAAMMGFGGFGTTKGKGIGVNAEGAVNVHKQRTWRQYMNRRGGFNRPLEKMK